MTQFILAAQSQGGGSISFIIMMVTPAEAPEGDSEFPELAAGRHSGPDWRRHLWHR